MAIIILIEVNEMLLVFAFLELELLLFDEALEDLLDLRGIVPDLV